MRRFSLVAVCLMLGGCGTYVNLHKDGPPYGGTREAAAAGLSNLNSAGYGGCIPPMVSYAHTAYWWLIDVPASGVADTLTLPIILTRQQVKASEIKQVANGQNDNSRRGTVPADAKSNVPREVIILHHEHEDSVGD